MANRNNSQTTNQQNRTRSQNRNRDYNGGNNRDYGRDYGSNRNYDNQREWTTYYYYTPDEDFPYEEEFYDYDTGAYPDTWSYTEYWLVPGPFVGYGPSDWQRSDENIREDVNERLTLHGHLDARQVHVQVDNGVVTLTGNVPSRREKRLAEDIVDSVNGVQDVQNQLHIENKNQQGQRQLGQGSGQTRSSANVQGGQIHQGMEVDSQDGQKIGTIKEIRNNTILVDRSMKEDLFIPFNAFTVQNNRVLLNVNADQVNNQSWQTPDSKAVQSHA